MKVYLAGTYVSAAESVDYPYLLESYHYIQGARHVARIREDHRTIFLDSGAFSMYTQGIEVNLDQYADFIKTNQDIIHVASNLDQIGQGREADTWTNQRYLEDLGVDVKPVFHVRDDDRWLRHYLKEGYDYIFIGGMVPESTKWLKQRLDQLWGDYLTDARGRPIVRIHGFGLTVIDLMARYPWYSVDSTSWVLKGRYGMLYVQLPHRVVVVNISDRSPRAKDWDQHYDTLPRPQKDELDRIFAAKGFTAKELREEYQKRDRWNIEFFRGLCDGPEKTFTKPLGLF